jgi:hypothetical protein
MPVCLGARLKYGWISPGRQRLKDNDEVSVAPRGMLASLSTDNLSLARYLLHRGARKRTLAKSG